MMTQTKGPVNHSPPQSDLRILWLPAFFCLILLTVEVYFALHDGSATQTLNVSNRGEPIAQFLSGKKIVRQKTVGTLVWESPVPNMPLYRESAIATMDDSEAILVFNDHSELIVEPNSLLILEEAPGNLVSGGTGKIVARLVKGSIKRKGAGATPFFIKLSRSKDAKPIQFNDQRGDSVFRVLYRLNGYEVVVESGTVSVDGQKTLNAGENIKTGDGPKLGAPKLRKPKIEILQDEKSEENGDAKKNGAQILWDFLVPEAEAKVRKVAKGPAQLSIRFAWDETPGAKIYLIQISKNPEFSEIFSENKVDGLEFHLKLPAPDEKMELYFRVAGISDSGEVGEFSSSEKVEVRPAPKTAVLPTPEPTPMLHPSPNIPVPPPAIVVAPIPLPTPAPTPAQNIVVNAVNTETVIRAKPPRTYVSISYGMRYQQRSFKNTSANPKEVSGAGFVPTSLSLEVQHAKNQREYFSIGGSFIYEKAKALLASPSDTAFPVSSFRTWLTYGKNIELFHEPLTYHFGPYFSSSSKVSENGLIFESNSSILIGLMAALQSDPELINGHMSWRVQLALLGLGSIGVDGSAWIRKTMIKSGAFQGLFCGLAFDGRAIAIESSWDTAVEIGFSL